MPTQSPRLQADRRLRRRHRAETRLRLYGMLALGLAAAALAALLWSVTSRAHLAMTETYLKIGVGDASTGFASRSTDDWRQTVRQGLRENFPDVRERRLRRELASLLSDGAAWDLADRGETVDDGQVLVLASDHADLYFKGRVAMTTRRLGTHPVRLDRDGEGYLLLAEEDGDFLAASESLRMALRTQAEAVREEARRLLEGAAEVAGDPAYAEERVRWLEQAEELLARANGLDLDSRTNSIAASESLPSVLVLAAGGVLRATLLSPLRMDLESLVEPAETGALAEETWQLLVTQEPPGWRTLSDHQIAWLESLADQGRVERSVNWRLLTASNSREPELAGLRDAMLGSFWTLLVCLVVAVPIGVLAALYLEEFAPRNRLTDIIEINVNNLAAVPSIVFGLLGLAAFIQFFDIPRSVPLVGGLVLALMTLPTVIIASRAAIRAVPQSIRDAALGVGASQMQTTLHHVLPLAMPGILTGAIIGMAQALGETAPLLLIGMVAFIVGGESGILEPASVLPVQIFQWSDFPELAFANRAAAAILVLVLFLVAMNLLAVVLRRRFERRW